MVQRQYISNVAKSRGNDVEFQKRVNLLEDTSASDEEREAAEKEIKLACLDSQNKWMLIQRKQH